MTRITRTERVIFWCGVIPLSLLADAWFLLGCYIGWVWLIR